ncbi:MAG: cysteine desulfurase [Candidatus Diapherotrites archaeon]|nr:cysteine desulfurase [Candidatus Diapherotrites archaeon]
MKNFTKDFPILNEQVNGKQLVYLDNGATSLTPEPVLQAMNEYYHKFNANVHRGIHSLSEKATEKYDNAHAKIAKFINANSDEIIFTRGTTEALNLLAYSLTNDLTEGDEILVSEMEHHANLVPWQQLAKQKGLKLKYIKVNSEGELDFKKVITDKTKIVSVTGMSNVLGTINPVKEIAKIAHEHGALLIVDAAQSVPHLPTDVKDLDCDFLTFSGHKMAGPTGIGVLYGKKELLDKMQPFMYGGDMIKEVTFKDSTWSDAPLKFEAGTPSIAEAIGLAAAIDYLTKVGMDWIQEHEQEITKYALEKLQSIDGLTLYGPKNSEKRGSVFSFTLKGIHAHDIAEILNQEGIAIRPGHMCAMPLVTQVLKQPAVARASFYFYNTKEEVDKLVNGLEECKKVFNV